MGDGYDVVIVGAGMGGLAAAATLAVAGRNVILLERHNVPGGYATSFVRGEFEFEVALHELSGIGDANAPADLWQLMDSLGMTDEIEFIPIPHLYRSIFPGLDIRLPAGKEAYVQTLIEYFPQDARGITTFMHEVFSLDFMHEVFSLEEQLKELGEAFQNNELGAAKILQAPLKYPAAFRYLPATLEQVLHRHVKNIGARAALSQYWGYFGLPPSKVSFFYFASALGSYVRKGAAFPRGRSQAISNAFVNVIKRHGGKVLMNCGVKRILHTGGKATGVLTEAGEELKANWVLSNADPITTARDLVGESAVEPRYMREIYSHQIGPSSLNVYLGLRGSMEDLGLTDHELFINEDYDFDSHHRNMRRIAPPKMMAVTTYNAVYPEISPPGTTIVVLTTLLYGEPWFALAPEQYLDTKNKMADAMLNLAEKHFPGLRDNAQVVEVSTPVTNARYAGTYHGGIYGFDQPPSNHTVLRFSPTGPLERLLHVGAWTQPGGGFHPSMLSGHMVAKQILKG